MGLTSVLLEGGSELNASALQKKLVNRVMLYVSPQLLGGQHSKSLIGGSSPIRLTSAVKATSLTVQHLGQDLLTHHLPGVCLKKIERVVLSLLRHHSIKYGAIDLDFDV